MYRISALFLLAAVMLNCESTPLQSVDMVETSKKEVSTQQENEPTCTENNTTVECQLELQTIDFVIPDTSCEPYEVLVQIDTKFYTPAGLNDGSTSRVDWEFLPDGNAGFWIASLDQDVAPNSTGSIQMLGCFTYGEQQTLRITRTIRDENGNKSNALMVNIPRPERGKIAQIGESAFEVSLTSLTTH